MIEDLGKDRRAREGLDAVTWLLLGKFVRRWGVILAVTLALGLIEPQLMPIFYAALAFAGIVALIIMGTRRTIANKLAQGAPHTIDSDAHEVVDDTGLIDVTPKEGSS